MENEFIVKEELKKKRSDVTTFDELIAYLQDVKDNYNIGYGEAPRAIAQAALATAWYFTGKFGITGFQGGFVMWDFIQDWLYTNNKCGMKIVDYDNMLFPQYGYRFEKTISSETFDLLQARTKELLRDGENAHPDVRKHWQSIVDGEVPFGYTICDD